MTKQELVTFIAETAGISKISADKALAAFTQGVESALKKGESVTLAGFGTFSVAERAARVGLNPQTGEKVQIAAKKAPKFKPGKNLKDALA